jgi:3',5'-cyclic AMP phosphodiesterase CpdA
VNLRIAHLSDIHFGGELRAAVAAAPPAVTAFAPHLVVVTGDLTLNGLPREFAAARTWLAAFRQPLLVTPGNHDTPYWNLVMRALVPFARYRRYIGPPNEAGFDAPGLSVRAINSARGAQPRLDWSKGAIALDALDAIDWGPGARVFACHHPLIDLAGAPVTGGVHRGAQAARRLAAAGVDLLLSGHVHVPFALPLNADEPGCWAAGAGTLSQRIRGAPPSFSTVVIEETALDVTVQAWTGGRFEPAETWRLPRRRREGHA